MLDHSKRFVGTSCIKWVISAHGSYSANNTAQLFETFKQMTAIEDVLSNAVLPKLKAAKSSRYILEAGGLDEKGDLWGLRGQDAEERQRPF